MSFERMGTDGHHVGEHLAAPVCCRKAADGRVGSDGFSMAAMIVGVNGKTGGSHRPREGRIARRMLGQAVRQQKDPARRSNRRLVPRAQRRAGRAVNGICLFEAGRHGRHA
jgi:hypothetical protein